MKKTRLMAELKKPGFDRATYDATRPDPRSGKHTKPSVLVRAPEVEIEAAARAAKRLGVTRNDLARAALRVASREDLPKAVAGALNQELAEVKKC